MILNGDSVLGAAGFETNGELVIKRIVNRSGKNRIYLNGSLAPLAVLADIGSFLVHIYGQHEHHTLLQPETHLNLLDAFADIANRTRINVDPRLPDLYLIPNEEN